MDPAYVHINDKHNREIDKVKRNMEMKKIYSIGRYGAWKYCSMEDCIIDAMELLKNISKGDN